MGCFALSLMPLHHGRTTLNSWKSTIGCPGLRGVHYPVVRLATGSSLIMPYLYNSYIASLLADTFSNIPTRVSLQNLRVEWHQRPCAYTNYQLKASSTSWILEKGSMPIIWQKQHGPEPELFIARYRLNQVGSSISYCDFMRHVKIITAVIGVL